MDCVRSDQVDGEEEPKAAKDLHVYGGCTRIVFIHISDDEDPRAAKGLKLDEPNADDTCMHVCMHISHHTHTCLLGSTIHMHIPCICMYHMHACKDL